MEIEVNARHAPHEACGALWTYECGRTDAERLGPPSGTLADLRDRVARFVNEITTAYSSFCRTDTHLSSRHVRVRMAAEQLSALSIRKLVPMFTAALASQFRGLRHSSAPAPFEYHKASKQKVC